MSKSQETNKKSKMSCNEILWGAIRDNNIQSVKYLVSEVHIEYDAIGTMTLAIKRRRAEIAIILYTNSGTLTDEHIQKLCKYHDTFKKIFSILAPNDLNRIISATITKWNAKNEVNYLVSVAKQCIPEDILVSYTARYDEIPCLSKFKVTHKSLKSIIPRDHESNHTDLIVKLINSYPDAVPSDILICVIHAYRKNRAQHFSKIWRCIEFKGYYIDNLNDTGNTPLMHAIRYNHMPMAINLLGSYDPYDKYAEETLYAFYPLDPVKYKLLMRLCKAHDYLPLTIEQVCCAAVYNKPLYIAHKTKFTQEDIKTLVVMINQNPKCMCIMKHVPLLRSSVKYFFLAKSKKLVVQLINVYEKETGSFFNINLEEAKYAIKYGWGSLAIETYKGPIEPLFEYAITRSRPIAVETLLKLDGFSINLLEKDYISMVGTHPKSTNSANADIIKILMDFAESIGILWKFLNIGDSLGRGVSCNIPKDAIMRMLDNGANPYSEQFLKNAPRECVQEAIKKYALTPNGDYGLEPISVTANVTYGYDPFYKSVSCVNSILIEAGMHWYHLKEVMRACFKRLPQVRLGMRDGIHGRIAVPARALLFASRHMMLRKESVPELIYDFFGTRDLKCLVIRLNRYFKN